MSHLAPGTFLATLNSDEREALQGLGVRRTFPRGSALMFQNEIDGRVMRYEHAPYGPLRRSVHIVGAVKLRELASPP